MVSKRAGLALLAFAALALMGFVALNLSVEVGSTFRDELIERRLAPIAAALEANKTPDTTLIHSLAADPLTRNAIGELLSDNGRLSLFPSEFMTSVRMAESDLVAWLAHPHELGAAPDHIEFMTTVKRRPPGVAEVTYFVFRFSSNSPHPAARAGAMAGVVGPYIVINDVVVYRSAPFCSDFEPYERWTAEDHAERIHRKILPGQLPVLLDFVSQR